jgi:hypothetical protein
MKLEQNQAVCAALAQASAPDIAGALKNDMFFIFNLLLIAKLANTTMSGYRVVRVAF